ncbi:glycosyltransferase family 2 protein [Gordonia hydrophobica]|uniref:Glycosyltransferase family 2 protein n=1 Tax=Gordonia hydrophobica TaxID=40516 RepID=A0ABZ2U1J3_9ACTN|nr:glycosyltransferase family 2 protein [Gordonia hydrophobica]MBM7366636.1 N-acetylglucosaminyl-diphospho-decaprenol L-rhamnosyltransferase [Gordonia hydrophobica]
MTASFAVVTVTFSSGDYLHNFLRTLPSASTQTPQVVIADNGSTDGAPEQAVADHDNVTLVHTGGNIGYGGAVNRGVAEIDPEVEFVLVANPDVEWSPGAIDELLAAATRWPRAASLGPLITEPDGGVYPSARRVPDLVSGSGHAILGAIWKSNPWTAAYRNDDAERTERPVGWLSGSCLLLRRVAFDNVGGFDSRYFMFMEDVDLGDRLGRSGWLNVFVPTASVMHAKSHSVSRHPEKMIPAHHESAYRFNADRNPGPLRAPLRVALRAGLAIRSKIAVAAALREQRRSGDHA